MAVIGDSELSWIVVKAILIVASALASVLILAWAGVRGWK